MVGIVPEGNVRFKDFPVADTLSFESTRIKRHDDAIGRVRCSSDEGDLCRRTRNLWLGIGEDSGCYCKRSHGGVMGTVTGGPAISSLVAPVGSAAANT